MNKVLFCIILAIIALLTILLKGPMFRFVVPFVMFSCVCYMMYLWVFYSKKEEENDEEE